MAHYIYQLKQLIVANSALLLAVTSGFTEWVPHIACIIAGVIGGTIVQLKTVDERRPTRKVILGDLLASAVGGFMAYVTFLVIGKEDFFEAVLLSAVLYGGAGSAGFMAAVEKKKLAWLDSGTKEE